MSEPRRLSRQVLLIVIPFGLAPHKAKFEPLDKLTCVSSTSQINKPHGVARTGAQRDRKLIKQGKGNDPTDGGPVSVSPGRR